MRPGGFRESGAILRPTKNPADGGREGQPEIVCPEWPFGFVESKAREMVVALQIVPLATHVLSGWDAGQPVRQTDYVLWSGRRLNIESVDDKHPPKLTLICVEQAP